jgi:hypothetical protein
VSCDPANNACTVKTKKSGTAEGYMTFAGYNGAFNAAKELKAGDKITGQWTKTNDKYYATIVVKEE